MANGNLLRSAVENTWVSAETSTLKSVCGKFGKPNRLWALAKELVWLKHGLDPVFSFRDILNAFNRVAERIKFKLDGFVAFKVPVLHVNAENLLRVLCVGYRQSGFLVLVLRDEHKRSTGHSSTCLVHLLSLQRPFLFGMLKRLTPVLQPQRGPYILAGHGWRGQCGRRGWRGRHLICQRAESLQSTPDRRMHQRASGACCCPRADHPCNCFFAHDFYSAHNPSTRVSAYTT
mmetsp:Transcript_324/g.566  ORF Transcript_324/g.566 Transcript_324/m.566 type:complete len:232 (-) Transcript_324:13-708(-)